MRRGMSPPLAAPRHVVSSRPAPNTSRGRQVSFSRKCAEQRRRTDRPTSIADGSTTEAPNSRRVPSIIGSHRGGSHRGCTEAGEHCSKVPAVPTVPAVSAASAASANAPSTAAKISTCMLPADAPRGGGGTTVPHDGIRGVGCSGWIAAAGGESRGGGAAAHLMHAARRNEKTRCSSGASAAAHRSAATDASLRKEWSFGSAFGSCKQHRVRDEVERPVVRDHVRRTGRAPSGAARASAHLSTCAGRELPYGSPMRAPVAVWPDRWRAQEWGGPVGEQRTLADPARARQALWFGFGIRARYAPQFSMGSTAANQALSPAALSPVHWAAESYAALSSTTSDAGRTCHARTGGESWGGRRSARGEEEEEERER